MLIIFSVNDQKITHDLKGQLVAGSVDIVQAAFKFDSSWDELDKIVVFTSSACPKPVPVQFADEAFYIPKDVLKPGKLYVSVVGFGLDGRKKTTQKWDIMQAITVQKCGDGGDCDLLRYYQGHQRFAEDLRSSCTVGSAEVDLTSYATRESVAKADDGLIKGIYNNMTASSEKYLGSGNLLLFWTLLKSLLNGHESSINDLLARVKLLELILSADVTGNPYYVTFNTLTDVVVSSGIWNKSDGRIEF